MTNRKELNKRIAESGKSKEYISNELGISLTSLNNKIAGRTEFKASEIASICIILHLNNEEMNMIFFKPEVSETDTKEVANA